MRVRRRGAHALYRRAGWKRAAPGDPEVAIALDPLEGTNLCAFGKPGALAVIAIGNKGCLMNAPDSYMEKIAVGPSGKGCISLGKKPHREPQGGSQLRGARSRI